MVASKGFKSVGGKAQQVTVPGIGKVWAEPGDTEDTFPPAIESYEFIDGWLVYHGRNGSVGVIVGSEEDLEKWVDQVDYNTSAAPKEETRPWTKEDGGSTTVREAVGIARKVLKKLRVGGAQIEVKVSSLYQGAKGEASGNTLTLINVHKPSRDRPYIGGVKIPDHLQVAAHEAAHLGFDKGGREVVKVLKQRERNRKGWLTPYHSSAGHFEGVMEAAAWYAYDPRSMSRIVPDVYKAVAEWFGDNASGQQVDEKALTQYAVRAFDLFRSGDTARTSEDVAYAVGAQARRLGWSVKDLQKWIQSAYGSVWVRQTNLSPGWDLKDVFRFLKKGWETRSRNANAEEKLQKDWWGVK